MNIFKFFKSKKDDVQSMKDKSERTLEKTDKKKRNFNIDAMISVVGNNITFWAASIISAFINLIFITGLTKSPYVIGHLSIPAALFLGAMSITLDFAKLLCVTQSNTLLELYRKLQKETWASKFKKLAYAKKEWYILYVILSIITSISLSTISISGAINLNQNQSNYIIKNINDITEMVKERDSISKDTKSLKLDKRDASSKATDKWNEILPIIEEWKKLRNDKYSNGKLDEYTDENGVVHTYQNDFSNAFNEFQSKVGRTVANKLVRNSGQKLAYLNEDDFVDAYKVEVNSDNNQYLSDNTDDYETISLKLTNKIQSLNDSGNIVTPDKIPVTLNLDPDIAINELDALKQRYATDDGDIGPSSKIFIQVAELINKNGHVTVSVEFLMMGMLLFLSLLIELTIYQTSPKIKISRKMLYQFTQYLPTDFNVNKFMDRVDKELINYDMIDISRKDETDVIKKSIKLTTDTGLALDEKEISLMKDKADKLDKSLDRISDLERTNTDLIGKVSGLEAEAEKLKKENIDNNAISINALSEKEKAIQSLKEQIKQLNENVSKVDNTNSEKENELSEKEKTLAAKEKELKELEKKNNSDKVDIDKKNAEIANFKAESQKVLGDIQKKYDDDTKKTNLTISNLTNEKDSLSKDNLKLEKENKELANKIAELIKAKEVVPIADDTKTLKTDAPQRVIKHDKEPESVIGRETIPYRFGRTSKSIMDKVDAFLDYIYTGIDKNAKGIYEFKNVSSVKEKVGLTEKEYSVFLDRLEAMEYEKMPILWEENGVYKSSFDKDWIKNYITRII